MKKIILLFLIISLFSVSSEALSAAKDKAVDLIRDVKKTTYTYLVLGLDDSANNTDVIMLFTYSGDTNSYSVLGIPRDCYYDAVPTTHKINGYVASVAKGGTVDSSHLGTFSRELSSSLGIKIDGAVAYTMPAIAGIVDTMGGIDLDVPIDMHGTAFDGTKVEIKAGKRHLSGKEAVFFIRYRESYALGDLGRMDAQKLFVSAVINKLKSDFNPEMAIKLLTYRDAGVITDIQTSEIISFALKNFMKMKDSKGCFSNLPGAAVISNNGVSYYSVNKKAAAELLSIMNFSVISEFDGKDLFRGSEEKLYTVYDSTGIMYKIYSEREIDSLTPMLK